ncbi:hypothetical protein ERX35_000895 [Macrococcus equipercicus]|nr:hypothetical protein ERX35_000895 [Macrococcus equipercicus]
MMAVLLTGCAQTAGNPSTSIKDGHHHHAFKDGQTIAVGKVKTYPLTKLKTTTIDHTIKVKDNDTIIYTEDTGHGIPTKPAGEGHTFHAILKVTYKQLSMYMLDDGTFVTADPKHVVVTEKGHHSNNYPQYKMHEDDVHYLNSLDKKDADYKSYKTYAQQFGQRQYDYTREMLMHTAIHAVNHQTPNSLEIPKESFQSFEAFKKAK